MARIPTKLRCGILPEAKKYGVQYALHRNKNSNAISSFVGVSLSTKKSPANQILTNDAMFYTFSAITKKMPQCLSDVIHVHLGKIKFLHKLGV